MDGLFAMCDRCVGRRFVGARGQQMQEETGAKERAAAGAPAVEPKDCPVCEDAFRHVPTWVALATEALATFEGKTFQLGTTFPKECEDKEKELATLCDAPPHTESIRTEANRLLTALVAEASGLESVTEERPQLVVNVDTRFHHAEIRSNPVFVAGRYTKFRRDLPQTHWPCRRCQGGGCWECEDSGVQYSESVEDAIGIPLKQAFEAESYSFHGAGREDIDALMLGTGRPFVLELKIPRKRQADLAALEAAINATTDTSGVGVRGLRMTKKEEVARIKEATYEKEYLAHCEAEEDVSEEDVRAACEAMTGVVLEQRTPQRVAHRRADLVRKRTVHRLVPESIDDARHWSLRVLADSGAYIKEMVSGDEGRTTPSFAETVGVPVRVAFLDVCAILDEPEGNQGNP